jgi:hypothetical protein
VLAFSALLLAAPAPSSAATYSLSFTGTVTGTFPSGGGGDVFAAAGIVSGDAVSGTLTFDPVVNSPGVVVPQENHFFQPSTTFSFTVSHPGQASLTLADSGVGLVDSVQITSTGTKKLVLEGETNAKDLQVVFETAAPPARPPLASLAGLPDTATGLMALLGGAPLIARGSFRLLGFGTVDFDIAFTPVAATPIPATLPLFVSALGGIGLVGWRRRARGAASA